MVTPIWRSDLSADEVIRLRLTEKATPGMDRFFVHPAGLDTTWLRAHDLAWSSWGFPDEHFASISAYSRWLLSPAFYEAFQNWDFIAIVQLDAVLLRPLPLWIWDYDYTGAPWNPPWRLFALGGRLRLFRVAGRQIGRKIVVGNGGLSIRRVHALRSACSRATSLVPQQILAESNEDAVLAYYARQLGLRLAPEQFARDAFIDLREDQDLDTRTLVGVHGLKSTTPRAEEAIRRFTAG